MSKTITWLHISDLHAGKPGGSWDSNRVTSTLVTDLKTMERENGLHPDFIFFTGDVAFGQDISSADEMLPKQFALACQFITSVCQAFNPSINPNNVFLVPGNHDVNRKVVGEDQTAWLDGQKDFNKINNLIDKKEKQWMRYMERLSAYYEFLKSISNPSLIDDPESLIYATIRQINGVKIGIGGFNTAWSCCRDGEKAKLWMGSRWQLEQVHSKLLGTPISIVLMHHPTNWLCEHEDTEFKHGLERDFKFILNGHEHIDWVTESVDGHTQIAAGACYDRSDKENGYNFVSLNLETGKGMVWLRKYDRSGGGWIPCTVHGKTNDRGIWPLSNQSWLTSIPNSLNTLVPPDDNLPQSFATEIPINENHIHFPWILNPYDSQAAELLDIPGMSDPDLRPKSAWVLFSKVSTAESAREDIDWQIVKSTIDDIPFENKTPSLQELRTEQQIVDHFLPLPKYVNCLDDWLTADCDRLFLGLPFCGKTTLLTYLALEASNKRHDAIIPIHLKPRESLAFEEIDVAVARLKKSLKNSGVLKKRQRVILIIDNVQTQTGFEITRQLMKSPRSWWIWAAARPRELTEYLSSGIENPWDDKNIIHNACDLIGKKEIDFVVDKIIATFLMQRGEEKYVEEIRKTMKEAGQVPVRFLIQVWKLILENHPDVRAGYATMIKAEPTKVETIIHEVMPRYRAGIDALTIASYLKRPSWELLLYILSIALEYGAEVANTSITNLRKTLALLPDSVQPCRATMYDPVRDKVKEPGNLTDTLKNQIWIGLESFIEKNDTSMEDGNPNDLADAWIVLSDLALSEKKYTTAYACAQRANKFAIGMYKEITLRQKVHCLYYPEPNCRELIPCFREILEIVTKSEKSVERISFLSQLANCLSCSNNVSALNWDEAILLYRQALELLTKPEQSDKRATTLSYIAHCLHHKPTPEWDEAIELSRQALELLTKPERSEERADTLSHIAYCLHHKPKPEWDEAIEFYRQALELQLKTEQSDDRASTLFHIAVCLRSKPKPEWDEAIEFYRQALELLTKSKRSDECANALFSIASCLRSKPKPEWDEAIESYHQALEFLKKPEQSEKRANTLYSIAFCLHNKLKPEWDEAIEHYRQALELQSKPEQSDDRASTLYHIAICLRSKPKPEWDEAIEFYRQALELLTKSIRLDECANALFSIASCLHNKPKPEWDEAIESYRQALELLTKPERSEERADTLSHIAYCLHHKPKPEWDEAIEFYRQALELLTKPEQSENRANTLYYIAFCLRSKPKPEWDEAIEFYRQVLELLTKSGRQDVLTSILSEIAFCLCHKLKPDWDEAIGLLRQAINMLVVPGQTIDHIATLHPEYTIGIIMALDGKGLYEEAEIWANRLNKSHLVEDEATAINMPIIIRRQAYLALRSNDLKAAISFIEELRDTSENNKAMLLASIVYFYKNKTRKARQLILITSPDPNNVAWIRTIAICYFQRYAPDKLAKYISLLT